MKKIHIYFFLIFLVIPRVFLSAQTAAELDILLETREMSQAQAARYVLTAVDGPVSQDSAFQQAMEKGWLPENAAANDPITLGSLSFLIMKAFDYKGGLMYMLLPGPRYAFRSLVSRSIIQGTVDPAMKVSGDKFLLILGNLLDAAGGDE